MTAPTLFTARLVLRGFRPDDRPAFASMNADPEVMRFFPAPLTRAESDALIDRSLASFAAGRTGFWAVAHRDDGAFVGAVALLEPTFEAPFTPCLEIGWRLARAWWGQGLATEAARALLAHAFGPLARREVVSFTTAGNHPSRRVMQRLGMSHDPADDFDHPRLPPGHPLRRHVLYRLARP